MASQTIDLTNETWINGTGNPATGEFPISEQTQNRIRCLTYFQFTSIPRTITINATGTAGTYKFVAYFYGDIDYISSTSWTATEEYVEVPNGATRYRILICRQDGTNLSPSEMSSITATINYAQEISVNSWSGFVTALNVSGAVVVLPENAVWDMNEILPYGLTENVKIACKAIYGNGTRIKNLNLNSYFFDYGGTDIKFFQDLLMTDWIGTNKFFNLRFGSQFTRCAISGITSNSVAIDNSNSYNYSGCIMVSCSVNVEGSHSGFHLIDSYSELKYCRIELHGMNSDNSSPAGSYCEYCELSLYFPNAETGSYGFPWSYYSGCILHGNMKSVSVCYEYSSSISIIPTAYDVDMFADSFVSTRPDLFIPCTDDQLKDPEYLRSKGFPIVVGG